MKDKKIKIALILVVLFSLAIRLFRLGQVPPSLHWDEPSWGYNAYSILKTGRDEYGNFLPLIFKAFGDYKSAIYVYLTVFSEAIFGLNEFAVRLPAAIFGALSIFLAFFVVKELFADFKNNQLIALLASFILALSPWHYYYSHSAWEVNILLVFLLLGILFFLKAERKKPCFLFLSAFFFGLCFYIYASAKLLIPLIILGLGYFFYSRLSRFSPKVLLISLAILGLMILPVFRFTFFAGAGGRLEEEKATPGGILGRYFNHFSARFLFFEGDWSNPRHSVPYAGVLNHLDIIFLVLGTWFLVTKGLKNQAFVWYFLAIAPLPAALSKDVVQATQSYFMGFPLAIITVFGMYFFFLLLKKLKLTLKFAVLAAFCFAYIFSFAYFFDQYFVHAPIQNSSFWQYGYKDAVEFIKDKTVNYDQVIFTQKYGQPYIYWLFYTRYNPADYQKQARLTESPYGDVGQIEHLDNIEFRNIYWPTDRGLKKRLFVGTQYELPLEDINPSQARILKEVKFLNNEVAFRIVETL